MKWPWQRDNAAMSEAEQGESTEWHKENTHRVEVTVKLFPAGGAFVPGRIGTVRVSGATAMTGDRVRDLLADEVGQRALLLLLECWPK